MNHKKEDLGVVYIVSGKFHAAAAIASAKSVRETNPTLKIDIFTDVDVDEGIFDKVHSIPNGHIRSKVDWLEKSRFEKTLYLDSDTRVVNDISQLFRILDKFDIALAHSHQRRGSRQNIIWNIQVPEPFPQVNGGVILYSNRIQVKNFLKDWSKAYKEAGFKWDQITLRELIWKSDLRMYILPPEYNIRYEKYLNIWDEEEARPYILHFAKFYEEISSQPLAPKRRDKSLATKIWQLISRFRGKIKFY